MEENQHEGPTIRRVPEILYSTCQGCKWLYHKMQRSGREPVYRASCTHPTVGNDIMDKGKEIQIQVDHTIHTPGWCPIAGIGVTENM